MVAYAFTPPLMAQSDEILDFLNRETKTISTKGHPKSTGLNVVVEYPNSWKASEGKRPHIIFNLISKNGTGLESCNLWIRQLDVSSESKVLESELNEVFSAAGLESVTPEGSVFIEGTETKIDGERAGVIQFLTVHESAEISIFAINMQYLIYHNERFLMLLCAVADVSTTSPQVMLERYNDHRGLFTLIANRLVIQDKWKEN